METISRRGAMGIAAGVLAGGVLANQAAKNAAAQEKVEEGNEPAVPASDSPYKFSMSTAHERRYGQSSIREHKLQDFPMSSNLSASLITLAVGDVREPHWHPNSDEWLFVMAGKVRMTIVNGRGEADQFDCGLEDVAFTPIGFGHYVENVGDEPARLMLVHNHADFTTVNLSEWVAGGATNVFASILHMPSGALATAPTKKVFIGPMSEK